MMKLLYIVLDGAGDRTYKELKGQSPLEYAKTPSLDELASKSRMGRAAVIDKKIAPESDAAVMSLLGYDVKSKDYPGRGVIEALGIGWKIRKDSVYFRANLATVNKKWKLIDTRADRIKTKQARRLEKPLNRIKIKGAEFEFKHTISHRGVLRVTSKGLSDNITGNNPFYRQIKKTKIHRAVKGDLPIMIENFEPRDNSIEAQKTAMLMNLYMRIAYEVLKDHPVNKKRRHPANILLLRGPGSQTKELKTMQQKTNLKWAGLVEMPVEDGICRLAGMKRVFVGKETDTNKIKTRKYLKAVLNNIKHYDALYIHIKGPDIPSHDGDLKNKIKIFEIIDKEFFTPLLKKIEIKKTRIIVTADHSTECAVRAHTARPTPVLIYKPGQKADGFKTFNEKNCKKGSIGLIKGKDIIKKIL